MKPENDKYLCDTYPKIFADRHAPMTKTAMCWGFDCGDGWFNIVDALCANIQNHLNNEHDNRDRRAKVRDIAEALRSGNQKPFDDFYPEKQFGDKFRSTQLQHLLNDPLPDVPEEVPQVVATQVKEKFGGLCFYYCGGDDTVHGMVRMAEAMSYRTCERCGNPGKPNREGWISTLCDGCRGDV